MNRLKVNGKFFCLDGKRTWIKCVAYGPFPAPLPDHSQQLALIKAAGFNSIRIYTPPSSSLLEAASEHDLLIFAGVPWEWFRSFIGDGADTFWQGGRIKFLQELAHWGNHPQVVAVYIANEIPSEIARWQGYEKTREALDAFIIELREQFPDLLYAYSNFPTSEYLEPKEADFTAFNVYLETEEKLESYLQHLHHLSGDRPVLISEFGLDTQRHPEGEQARLLNWQLRSMRRSGMAGATIFTWSDRWKNGDLTVDDWSFGLTRRDGSLKPAIASISQPYPLPTLSRYPMISVIVCVHNGADRVLPFLDFAAQLNYPCYEVLIIDDGSVDHLDKLCEAYPSVRYIRQDHSGLSAARNLGARKAKGDIFAYTDDDCVPDADWLYWIARAYIELECDLCGGPNLAPLPSDEDEAVVASAPGAPSHVMFSNTIAEHIPGCNLTVTRGAFELLGGFNERYWVAGDDVDFCWRAHQQQLTIGFHGAAFVWHRRRASFQQYFRQQRGYGKAEALLLDDHPDKFSPSGDAKWDGVIYQGGSVSVSRGDTIYSGAMGSEAFQSIHGAVMPRRPLHRHFRSRSAVKKLNLANRYHPLLRRISRLYYGKGKLHLSSYYKALKHHFHQDLEAFDPPHTESSQRIDSYAIKQKEIDHLINEGWVPLNNDPSWDLQRGAERILLCMENLGGGAWLLRTRKGTIT